MKSFIYVLIFACIAQISIAQKCKFEINGTDEFTGVQRIRTYATQLNSFFKVGFNIHAALAKEDTVISLIIVLNVMEPLVVDSGNKVYFKLSDGSIVYTKSPKTNLDVNHNTVKAGNLRIEQYSPINEYPITINMLKKIANLGISKVRVETSTTNLEWEVPKKNNIICTMLCEKLNNREPLPSPLVLCNHDDRIVLFIKFSGNLL